jgi:DNA polymerase III epsilon subunit-like protein
MIRCFIGLKTDFFNWGTIIMNTENTENEMGQTAVMLDLETLGTTAGSAILAIGAVRFNEGGLLDDFYVTIDLESCEAAGLRIDARTLLWGLAPSEEPRPGSFPGGGALADALVLFARWVAEVPVADDQGPMIWCKGASFDFPILTEAYERCSLGCPWVYWRERCLRSELRGCGESTPKMDYLQVEHTALLDARFQAYCLLALAKNYGRKIV